MRTTTEWASTHEREVLLPPLTGIETLGTDVEGSLMIIHSRLSLNLGDARDARGGGDLDALLQSRCSR
jgi:hypothetical protein